MADQVQEETLPAAMRPSLMEREATANSSGLGSGIRDVAGLEVGEGEPGVGVNAWDERSKQGLGHGR